MYEYKLYKYNDSKWSQFYPYISRIHTNSSWASGVWSWWKILFILVAKPILNYLEISLGCLLLGVPNLYLTIIVRTNNTNEKYTSDARAK